MPSRTGAAMKLEGFCSSWRATVLPLFCQVGAYEISKAGRLDLNGRIWKSSSFMVTKAMSRLVLTPKDILEPDLVEM